MPTTKYFDDLKRSFPSMSGKTVAITGCTSGTGWILAKTCAELGAKVVMLNRRSERAEKAYKTLKEELKGDAVSVECDLQSFDSVKKAGATLREMFKDNGIDVLCNNAGVMGLPDQATQDGFDIQMQSNHLSHFLLTSQVWPLLELAAKKCGEARVVNHSSGARKTPARPLTAKYLGRNGGNLGGDGWPGLGKWQRYQQTKLANLLFTYALHDKAAAERPGSKVKIVAAHPGPTASDLQGKTTASGGRRWLDRFILNRSLKRANSVEDGASGIARCSCEPGVESLAFYGPVGTGMGGPAVLLPQERDPAAESLLWTESLKSTGITQFFG